MTAKELIEAALSLPTEERTLVAETLLRSLNTPRDDVDKQWVDVARARLAELRSGEVEAVPGDEVLARLHGQFAK